MFEEGEPIVIFGLNFKVLLKIGNGTFGEVWLIENHLGNRLAMKISKCNQNLDLELKDFVRYDESELFLKECRSLLTLDLHSNIVFCYGIDRTKFGLAILMEYFGDGSLRRLITENRTLSLKTILDIAIQIANGMQYIHEKGIIHRDLKPENILVKLEHRNSEVLSAVAKISDFGLIKKIQFFTEQARSNKANTSHNDFFSFASDKYIVGTYGYASPEQLLEIDKPVDKNSDIFSFGVVLFELFFGKLPFVNGFISSNKHLHEYIEKCSKDLNIDIPQPIKDVIEECIKFDPDDRWKDIKSNGTFEFFGTIYTNLIKIYNKLGEDYKEIITTPTNFLYDQFDNSKLRFKAISFYQIGDFEASLQYLEQAIGLNSDDFVAYRTKGIVLYKLKRIQESVQTFDDAIQLDPNFPDTYYDRSLALRDLKFINQAFSDLRTLFKLSPNYDKGHYLKALLLMDVGIGYDHKYYVIAAVYYLNIFLNKFPNHINGYIEKALCLFNLECYEEALNTIRIALERDVFNSRAFDIEGAILCHLNRSEEGQASFDKAIQYKPGNSYYYVNKGSFYSKDGDHQKAVNMFDIAIRLKPNYPIAYYNKSISLYAMNKITEAFDSWRDYLKYNLIYEGNRTHFAKRLYE
ncbi:MAG TPA: protein kinase [Nitrososphaeraceae archaeon]|nr:protein kinase [Nitrososphaeraceae archaeon]